MFSHDTGLGIHSKEGPRGKEAWPKRDWTIYCPFGESFTQPKDRVGLGKEFGGYGKGTQVIPKLGGGTINLGTGSVPKFPFGGP